jgi:23S rRNA (adenine-C8)-methyltransferase
MHQNHRFRQFDRSIKFALVLREKGIDATIQTQFGSDIDAACGQLQGSE